MAKSGTDNRPAVVRVQTTEKAQEIVDYAAERGASTSPRA